MLKRDYKIFGVSGLRGHVDAKEGKMSILISLGRNRRRIYVARVWTINNWYPVVKGELSTNVNVLAQTRFRTMPESLTP